MASDPPIPRRLMMLAGAMFVLEAALYSALAPMLARYAHQLNLSKLASGVLVGSYAAGLLFGSAIGPVLATRASVRATAIAGVGVFGLSSFAFGFAGSIGLLDMLRLVQGTGAGLMWVAGLTWVVSSVPPSRHGSAIGATISVAIVGTLMGPLLGTLALAVGTRLVFAALGLLCGLLLAGLTTLPSPPNPDRRRSRAPSMLRRARAVRAPVWMTVLVATAVGAMNALLPLLFDSLGVGHIGIGAIFLAGAVVAAAGSPLVGRLADRRDRWGIARTAIALSLALTFAMAAIRSVGALAPVAILALALWPMASIPLMTIAAEEAERAGIPVVAAMSSLTIAWALGELIGAPVGSAVAQVGSYAMSLTLLGLVAAAAVAAVTPTVRSALSGGRG